MDRSEGSGIERLKEDDRCCSEIDRRCADTTAEHSPGTQDKPEATGSRLRDSHRLGNHRPELGRRGFYAIITAFFLVLTIVIALVWFFGVYQTVFRLNTAQHQHDAQMASAKLFKDRLLICDAKTVITQERLEAQSCPPEGVKGYKIVQAATSACPAKTWSVGTVDQQDSSAIVYWVVVRQRDATTCLGQLRIYQ